MQLVVDPIWLSPPGQGEGTQWLRRIKPLQEIVDSGSVKVSCPKSLRDQMVARWFEGGSYNDLVRTLNELEGRLVEAVELDEGPALLDHANADPDYTWSELDDSQRETFIEHLAEAALARDEGQAHLGVLSPVENWSEPKEEVRIEAVVLERETSKGYLVEPNDEAASLRHFLTRSESIAAVFSVCSKEACALIRKPEFGIMAYFAGSLGGDAKDLRFEIGPAFLASIDGLGIDRVPSDARTLLRTMALIASGKGDQVEGHEERIQAGAGSKTVCHGEHPVIRSYVTNHTPNAMRLFWVRKDRPLFLNVTGHDGSPAL